MRRSRAGCNHLLAAHEGDYRARTYRQTCAPVLAFATVPLADFQVSGSPRRYRSSDFGERWFCAECGTPLAMHVDHQPDTIDFTIASLDEPGCVRPEFHIFVDSRIAWFDTRDSLARYPRFRPETPGLPLRLR